MTTPFGQRPKKGTKRTTGPPAQAIIYRYSASRIDTLRKHLEKCLAEFVGDTPRGSRFERLVRIVQEELPAGIEWQVLEDSLRHLAGTHVTGDLVRDAAWRMAGNVRRLKQRRPVPPWHGQRLPEWVPLRVLSARHYRSPRGKVGALFSFRVVAGTPCPLVVWKWWSLAQCRYYAVNFGFSKPKSPYSNVVPRYPYSHPAQLVTLQLYGLVDPDECGTEPGFSLVAWPTAVSAWNKEQVRHRFRVDAGYDCPRGHPAAFECHKCPAPYTECRASTHRLAWEVRPCPVCENPNAVFDPEVPANRCINCYVKAVYRGD